MKDPLHAYIEVKNTREGQGLFAAKAIKRGTVILKIWGKTLCFDQTIRLKNKESYCLQIERNKYIALHYPIFLSNHSCNPNCGINKNLEFITLKDIAAGKELRWDYSTSMMERCWTMQCSCGEENCRGLITDFDLIPEQTQKRYIEMGIVMPYILDMELSGLKLLRKE
jgi:hypothetical protein